MLKYFAFLAAPLDKVKSGWLEPYVTVHFQKALGAMGLSALCLLLVCCAAWMQADKGATDPVPSYSLVLPHSVKRIQVLNRPSLSNQKIVRWSSITVRSLFSFNFTNADAHLADSARYFTASGWQAFSEAMRDSPLFKDIKEKQMVATVVPLSAARVTRFVDFDSYQTIDVEMTLMMTLTGAQHPVNRQYLCRLVLSTVPTTINVDGLAIAKIYMEPYR